MGISTHRTNTANPRRTQLDSVPVRPDVQDDVANAVLPDAGPTANPRRTNLMEQQG